MYFFFQIFLCYTLWNNNNNNKEGELNFVVSMPTKILTQINKEKKKERTNISLTI
jgi:hypothetical protein